VRPTKRLAGGARYPLPDGDPDLEVPLKALEPMTRSCDPRAGAPRAASGAAPLLLCLAGAVLAGGLGGATLAAAGTQRAVQLESAAAPSGAEGIFFLAHRGGAGEVPENTLAAFRHAWSFGGIPEVDLQTTKDGVIIAFHDDTPARTTSASLWERYWPISSFRFDAIRRWDVGTSFDPRFAGETVPSLREVFSEMRGRPDRQVYLDPKGVDPQQLGALIDEFGVGGRVIFSSSSQERCVSLRRITAGVRTMMWIGGSRERVQEGFRRVAATGFRGLDQIQLHLRPVPTDGEPIRYEVDSGFLLEAHETAREARVELGVFPYEFDDHSLRGLLGLGIRWFGTDYPKRFGESVRRWSRSAR
jgi:glycerophosphoryl diester phosphodiesterase